MRVKLRNVPPYLGRAGVAVVMTLGASGLAVIATGLQLLAQDRLEFRSSFSFSYLAVLLSSLRWGRRGGVITAVVSGVLAALFVLGPGWKIPWGDVVERTELILFAVVSISIIVLVDRLRTAREALARQRDDLEVKVRERTRALEQYHKRVRLSKRMAAVGGMAAGLAHDLANLIMPMQMRLKRLAERHADPASVEDVGAVVRCVEYLSSLASGLRLFSRDPARAAACEVTHPAAWVRDTTPFFRNVLPRHVELKMHVPENLPDLAVAPHRLTQAVINLIGNARDALGSRPGVVTVTAQPAGEGRIRVEVADDGPGMTDDVRRRCLEPYFTTRDGEGGTGLGLALVHDVVRSAGGELQIDSAPGRGARFVLSLPAAPVPAGEPVRPRP